MNDAAKVDRFGSIATKPEDTSRRTGVRRGGRR